MPRRPSAHEIGHDAAYPRSDAEAVARETGRQRQPRQRRDMVDEIRLSQQRAKSRSSGKGEGKGGRSGGGKVYRAPAEPQENAVPETAAPEEMLEGEEEGSAPAKKRRRRRRKPAGGGGGSAESGNTPE
jgi:poly(A) polymerase